MSKSNTKTSQKPLVMLTLSALFTALVAVGTFIRIPLPFIPITLQTLLAMLAGLLLGRRYGTVSLALYAVLGIIGLPIFTFGGGPGAFVQPTFGYIIGFIPGAFVIGTIARNKKQENPGFVRLLLACLAGIGVIYLFGAVYWYILGNYVIASPVAVKTVLVSGVLACLPGDILKAAVAAILAKRLIPLLSKYTVS